jgi:hypothetical protein
MLPIEESEVEGGQMKRISQREARSLKKELFELKRRLSQQMNVWSSDYPKGIHLLTMEATPVVIATVKTARKLSRAIVVTQEENQIRFYACEAVR